MHAWKPKRVHQPWGSHA